MTTSFAAALPESQMPHQQCPLRNSLPDDHAYDLKAIMPTPCIQSSYAIWMFSPEHKAMMVVEGMQSSKQAMPNLAESLPILLQCLHAH